MCIVAQTPLNNPASEAQGYSCFAEGQTGAQRGEVTHPRSLSIWRSQDLDPDLFDHGLCTEQTSTASLRGKLDLTPQTTELGLWISVQEVEGGIK